MTRSDPAIPTDRSSKTRKPASERPPRNDPPEDREKEVLEEKSRVTTRISETTRYLGFGLLASFYAMISSGDPFPQKLEASSPTLLRLMALCGALAVSLDYLQYVFARWSVQRALDRTDKPYHYNRKWLSYRAREMCFLTKQVVVLLGCGLFIFIVIRSL